MLFKKRLLQLIIHNGEILTRHLAFQRHQVINIAI